MDILSAYIGNLRVYMVIFLELQVLCLIYYSYYFIKLHVHMEKIIRNKYFL